MASHSPKARYPASVRLEDSQRDQMYEAMERRGINRNTGLSEYIRRLIDEDIARLDTSTSTELEALQDKIEELQAIARRLSKVAR